MADDDKFFGDDTINTDGSDDSSLDDFFQPAATVKPAEPKAPPKPKAPAPPPPKAPATPPPPKMAAPPPPPLPPPPPQPPIPTPPKPQPIGRMEPTPMPEVGEDELFPIQRSPKPFTPPPPPIPPQLDLAPPAAELPLPDQAAPVHVAEGREWGVMKGLIIGLAGILILAVLAGGGYLGYKFVKGRSAKKPTTVAVAKPPTPPAQPDTPAPTAEPPAAAAEPTAPAAAPATPSKATPTKSSTPAPTPAKKPEPVAAKPATAPKTPAKPEAAPAAAKPATAPVAAKPAAVPSKPAAAPAPKQVKTAPAAAAPVSKPAQPPAAKVEPFAPPALPELPPVKSVPSGKFTVHLERLALSETVAMDAERLRKAGLQPYRVVESRATSVVQYKVVLTFPSLTEANEAAKKIYSLGLRPSVQKVGSGGGMVIAAVAFSESGAREIMSKVEGQGIKGAKVERKPASIRLQALRIGQFDSESSAAETLSKAKASGFTEAVIIRVR